METIYNYSHRKKQPPKNSEWLQTCNFISYEVLWKTEKERTAGRIERLLDPLQFAYRANRGVQDATITLLNLIYKHLEGNKNHVRLLFVDFSSAFNTIQPHLLVQKLIEKNFGLDYNLVGWI